MLSQKANGQPFAFLFRDPNAIDEMSIAKLYIKTIGGIKMKNKVKTVKNFLEE